MQSPAFEAAVWCGFVSFTRNRGKAMNKAEAELRKTLETRLQFEMLLSEISTGFINIPADQVEDRIEDAQRRVCECLDIDRSTLWLIPDNDPAGFSLVHLHQPAQGPRVPDQMRAVDSFPWSVRRILAGELVSIASLSDLPADADRDRESFRRYETKSTVLIPLAVAGKVFGALTFARMKEEHAWAETMVTRLQLVAQIFSNALARKKANEELLRASSDIQLLKEQLESENIFLREDVKKVNELHEIVGQSDGLRYVLYRVEQVAATDATVLILGETGTGKEVIAQAIHSQSQRRNLAMVTVNCAALPANLIESELFGREKGAFTGSHSRQMGRFEVADRGTVFLDEIGELPLELQSKLLRVIQDGEFERLGSPHTIKVNVRIIASTSRDLKDEIKQGRFREDLYYRLNVFPITIPPLRKRSDDVPLLVEHFVKKFSRRMSKEIKTIPRELVNALQDYSWPGNVRELEHVIERAVITTQGPVLRLAERIEAGSNADLSDSFAMADVEREHVLKVLEHTRWRIEGARGAAALLGLNPSTLRSRLHKMKISRPA